MAKIKIVTDSGSDISYKHEDLYDIEVLPFKVTIGDESYVSRVDFDNAKFFEMMEETDEIPKTSQITAFEFGELFGDLFEQDYTDVIYVSINSSASATYMNAMQAKAQFFEDNPDAADKMNIYCVDSGNYSAAYGYPVVEAAKMADKGASAEEIVVFLEEWFKHVTIYFGIYSLKYAKKSGRIPAAAAFVGELIGLRPILRIFNKEIIIESKTRGDASVIPALCKQCAQQIEKGAPYIVICGDNIETRDELAEALTETLGYPPADAYQIGAAVAVNSGPIAVGVAFKSK